MYDDGMSRRVLISDVQMRLSTAFAISSPTRRSEIIVSSMRPGEELLI